MTANSWQAERNARADCEYAVNLPIFDSNSTARESAFTGETCNGSVELAGGLTVSLKNHNIQICPAAPCFDTYTNEKL